MSREQYEKQLRCPHWCKDVHGFCASCGKDTGKTLRDYYKEKEEKILKQGKEYARRMFPQDY